MMLHSATSIKLHQSKIPRSSKMINGIDGKSATLGMMRAFSMKGTGQQMPCRVDPSTGCSIDKIETQKSVNKVADQLIPAVNFHEQFATYDADGKLSADEAKVALAYPFEPRGANRMPSKIDQNSDGSIDKSEMQALVDKLAEHSGQSISVDELFSQYDADADGTLSADEAKEALAYLFEQMRVDWMLSKTLSKTEQKS
jgi:Ca2+-binding EF-hand superfamily protein